MNYKFTKKNLLDSPENYMYSEFKGTNFLNSYILNRQSKINKFSNNNINNLKKIKEHYEANLMCLCKDNYIKLSEFDICEMGEIDQILNTLLHGLLKKRSSKKKIILITNIICQKFEISKKLKNNYSNKVKISYVSDKRLSIYIKFSAVLCLVYNNTQNIRYLNTYLKVNDLILSSAKLKNLSKLFLKNMTFLLIKELEFINILINDHRVNL